MNKILKITLSIVLFLLLTIIGLSFFIFSQTGNELLKPYVKETLEEKIGLPVEVNRFKLDSGTSSLEIVINKQAFVNVATEHNLWSQAFEGTYQIKTDRFTYEQIKVKDVDIHGDFKGDPEDIYVEGQGKALGAALDYRFNLIDESAQKIMANMKGAHFSEVLQLVGYPALAEGKIDVEINMPEIGEETASGYGHIVLNKATFDRALVKELYHYTLPKKSYVEGRVDATLEGKSAQLAGDIKSNLFALQIKDAVMDMDSDEAKAAYRLDVKDMRILTKNKLAGPFKIEGNIEKKDEVTRVTGTSRSLGGVLDFMLGETAKVTLEKLSLEKLLAFLKQPDYAKGELSGNLVLEELEEISGTYRLQVDKGVLNPKTVEKMAGYKIPEENTFTFESKGEIENALLSGNALVVSTLTDITLPSFEYDLKQNTLVSEYDILVHDINALIPKAKEAKATPVSAKGTLNLTDTLSISGVTEGLGKKVAFEYDSKTAKVDISELSVEKVLALSGLPVYVKGTIDSHIDFTNLDPQEGTFSLKSSKLVTQPDAMKQLTGEAFNMHAVVESSGRFKEGKGTIHTDVKSSVGDITLDNMVYDAQKQTLKSSYTIDIPDLKEVQPLIGQKLYGPLLLKGEFSKDKVLQVTGATTSLGGKIDYILKGDDLTSTISSVPLENILGTLGHKRNFLGSASGKAKYNLKRKSGVVDLDIASFQIKPSDLTKMISLAIGKDPARVIFSSTKFHADIDKNIIDYTLHAVGTRSSIDITQGRLNTATNTNTARFSFVYEDHRVRGKIKGSVNSPKITIDTSALIKDKIDEKVQEKLDKALGGQAAEFLKSLPF
ncbi:hypothetical protein MN086_10735 [Sulfurovum sp. XGS-02]|uniref:hypothetical protein n=1 Tax=Sulfurovum sp. XGS-02 TaxID=2925411 RepID=UPI0020497E6C|nr:hypothetical protein [Sulfurovum sp. XGS-02]UPT77508.1 hypothetical protein MN086_10735 [Sulfurovum sp. XGS-02]